MKIWIDPKRQAPCGYIWIRDISEAKRVICNQEMLQEATGEKLYYKIEAIDICYDLKGYADLCEGYIEFLDWLESSNRDYPIYWHAMNPINLSDIRDCISYIKWVKAEPCVETLKK